MIDGKLLNSSHSSKAKKKKIPELSAALRVTELSPKHWARTECKKKTCVRADKVNYRVLGNSLGTGFPQLQLGVTQDCHSE